MKRLKWTALAMICLAIVGCARTSVEATRSITGYTEGGELKTTAGTTAPMACPLIGSYFAARCEDSGFKVLTAADCSLLCSGPAEL